MKKRIYHKANVIFSNLSCMLSMSELLQSNARNKIIFTFFTIADLTCFAWSNIIFTWVYYWHHFYYVPIIIGHGNNILWKKKKKKNILCLDLLHHIKTIIYMLILYFVCSRFACRTPKNSKILFSLHEAARTSRMIWRNLFRHRSTQSAFF